MTTISNIKKRQYANRYSKDIGSLPFCNREEDVLDAWTTFNYNIEFRKKTQKGKVLILGQNFGSGKTEFAQRIFREGHWQSKVKERASEIKYYNDLSATTVLYIENINPYLNHLEMALSHALLNASYDLDIENGRIPLVQSKLKIIPFIKENYLNLDTSLGILKEHYGTEICIILDEISRFVDDDRKKYYREGTTPESVERYYKILNVLTPIAKEAHFIIAGKTRNFSMIGHQLYHDIGYLPPVEIKHMVLSPLEIKHLKKIIDELQVDSKENKTYKELIGLKVENEEKFLKELHQYTAGVPRIVEYTLRELYLLNEPVKETIFEDSKFASRVMRAPGVQWNSNASTDFGLGYVLLKALADIPIRKDEKVPVSPSKDKEIQAHQYFSYSELYIAKNDEDSFKVVLPKVRQFAFSIHDTVKNFLSGLISLHPHNTGYALEYAVAMILPYYLSNTSSKLLVYEEQWFEAVTKNNIGYISEILESLKPSQIGRFKDKSHSPDILYVVDKDNIVCVQSKSLGENTTLSFAALSREIEKTIPFNIGKCHLILMSMNLGKTLNILSGEVYETGHYLVKKEKGNRKVEKFSLKEIPTRVSFTVPENFKLSVFSPEQMKKFFGQVYKILQEVLKKQYFP